MKITNELIAYQLSESIREHISKKDWKESKRLAAKLCETLHVIQNDGEEILKVI